MKNKQANNLIVICGGIGDVLLWVPALKACDQKPDVLYLYGAPRLKILEENSLVKEVHVVKGKTGLLSFSLKSTKKYNTVFLNHLCGGSALQKAMQIVSETIITNSPHIFIGEKRFVLENVQDAAQNYFLVHNKKTELKQEDFQLEVNNNVSAELPTSFISLHLSAGNNQTPYKNWPVKHWSVFLTTLLQKFTLKKIILLGHSDEEALVKELGISNPNIISLVGKTSIDETFSIISRSEMFIGPDGGLMHVAVSVGKPTFTIWGGSSPILYGYENLIGGEHKIVKQNLNCMPCNAWLHPNTSKTSDPLKCPDFACLRDLSPEVVFKSFESFYPSLKKAM